MDMKPVKSSNIAAVGYDPAETTMHIQFSNGTTYAYEGVTQEQHDAFVSADSLGRHFAKNIKPNYAGKKLPAQDDRDRDPVE